MRTVSDLRAGLLDFQSILFMTRRRCRKPYSVLVYRNSELLGADCAFAVVARSHWLLLLSAAETFANDTVCFDYRLSVSAQTSCQYWHRQLANTSHQWYGYGAHSSIADHWRRRMFAEVLNDLIQFFGGLCRAPPTYLAVLQPRWTTAPSISHLARFLARYRWAGLHPSPLPGGHSLWADFTDCPENKSAGRSGANYKHMTATSTFTFLLKGGRIPRIRCLW